jgi:prefoldin subunit 5
MSFVELCKTSKELTRILDSGDDLKQLQTTAESVKNVFELVKQQHSDVKRCIRALAKLEEKERNRSSTLLQENKENGEAISRLEREKCAKAKVIEKLNIALGSLENSMREIDLEGSKLRHERAGIEHQASDVLPKTKYSFSLYSNITRLRWDYDSTNDDKLQGFVSSLRDVRPFSLNLNEHSSHFIANYLWDVIASAKKSQE